MLLSSSAFPPSQVYTSTLDTGLPESPSTLLQSAEVQHLIFVDATVQDYESLITGINASAQVVMLNANQDGIKQITNVLEQHENLSSVQIIAHGNTGVTQLGNARLSTDTLSTYAGDIQQWGNALTEQGDLLFFGCNVGGNAEGYAFVEAISQLSGADVAASDDLTGSGQNGDWEQEIHIGTIEAESAIAPQAQASYPHLLALPNTDDLVMTLDFNETSGTTTFDSSPNGLNNNGVLRNGASFRNEGVPYEGVVDFDGIDDYISVSDSTDINIGTPKDERTISLWFNANDVNTSTQKQVLYEEGGGGRGFNLYIDNGQLYVGGWNTAESGWSGTYLSTGTIASNTWHHVTLVLDATPDDTTVQSNVFTAYLDGVQFGQGDGSQIWGHGDNIGLGAIHENTRFHDGILGGTGNQAFAGSIADTYLYNRALDSSEIGLLADASNLPPASLDNNFVMHLTLDETSGTQAADTSPAGLDNPGTLQNGAQFEAVGADLGNGVRLDGNDDYIQVDSSSDINLGNPKPQRTISAWFNLDDVNVSERKQVIYEEGGISRGFNIYVDDGQLYVGGWNAPESNWIGTFLSTGSISSNTWHHVALVLDAAPDDATVQSNVFTAYLDGESFGEGDGSQLWGHGDGIAFGALNSATLFHDGGVIGTGTQAAAGVIADGQLYNRALSAAEIQSLADINVPGGTDTAPPTATVTATDLTTSGGSTYDFTVTFSDDTAIDVSTLDSSDVIVTGPNSFSQVATFVSVDVNADGTPRTATYQLTAPNTTWESTDNGTYTLDLVADQVGDTNGNNAIASTLGTFDVNITPVDTTPPTAAVTAPDLTTSGGTTYDFTVTFTDDTAIDVSTLDSSDVIVTGPNSFSQIATFVSVDVNADGTPRTATYQVTAPNTTWESTDNGTYTVDLVADQVGDTNGNNAIAATLGTFDVNITPVDTTPPTAAVTAPDLTTSGGTTYDFTVTFTDDTAIDVSTLDSSDVIVTGPNSFSQIATFVSVDVNADGTPRTATYQLTAPNTTWESTDNGTYTVDLVADQVGDTNGNNAIAATLGTFDVNITPVDTTPPTAAVTAPDLTTSGGTTYDFTVTFTDDTAIDVSTLDSSDVIVTGPNSFSQIATFVSVDVNADGTPRTATYQLTAPNTTWESTDNGTYTVDLVADQVGDTNGNNAIAATLGTFDVNITPVDTTPPTASLTASDLTAGGTSIYDFTVVFDDDTAIAVATLDSNDVLVTGPNNFSQVATFVSVDVNSDGTPRTVTYRLTNSTWDDTDNGSYTVALLANQVSDTSGNNAIADTLGTFNVVITPANDDDFVMHLTLDETSGTTAADSSPAGLDNFGTLQNGAQFEAVGLDLGGGVRFDGNNDYILVDNSNDIDEGSPKAKRTIAVWFRADDVGIASRKQVIFEEGGSGRGLNIYIDDGQLYVGGWNLQESGWNGTFLSTNTVASSTWQHVALVLDADPGNATVQTGVFKAYLNGVLFGTGDGSQVWAHGDGNGFGAVSGGTRFHDGSVFGPGTQAMSGVIADGRLYNRVLSDTDIQSLAALNVPAPNDGTPPSATLSATDINTSGAGTYTFTVTYTDEAGTSPSTAIDVSTLSDNDIEVKGPNGFRQFATLVSVDDNTDGLTRTATYQITTPGGSWDVDDTGTYYAIIQDKEVGDVVGNKISADLLGTFEVDLIPASSPIAFTEVTDAAGLTNVGSSFGASWGDFNGDGLPDLWVSNHGKPSILYQNNGDGTFTNAVNTAFTQAPLFGDTHGQAWADFDNDGDEDVIVTVGGGSGTGTGANRLYVNDNGVFTEQAAAYGLEYALGRGRTPIWIDYDNDGLLDLWVSNLVRPDGQAPPTIFRQTSDGTFEDVRTTTNIEVANSEFAALGDFTGDGTLDIVSRGFNPARNFEELTIYDTATTPFQDVSDSLLVTDFTAATDFAVADFNNDLKPDLFIAQNDRVADINQETTTLLEVDLISLSSELGLEFTSSGDITFDLTETGSFALNEIFIGSAGINPTSKEFTLSASDPNVEGLFPHVGGTDKGIYIGYDSVEDQWRVLASSDLWANTKAGIHVANANGTCGCSLCHFITNVNSIGFDDNAPSVDDQLLINSAQGLVNQTLSSGLNDISNFSESVVAGDFDNDMDVDLYVLTTDRVTNGTNILYENQGDGTFARVAGAGGAAGSLLGVGDSVTTVDYDGDGFLDLFVTNGADPIPYNEDGPNQLFRNAGNDNHWIQIDLSGVASNKDGIGAQVFVTAGGVTQMREMSGGVHKFAQNHDRLHFGLAANDTIDEIVIRWPSGTEQTLTNVSADQILTILEETE